MTRVRRLILPLGFLFLVFIVFAIAPARSQAPAAKMSTVLADLASVVRQDDGTGFVPLQSTVPPLNQLPQSARDGITTRWLRLDSSNMAQVYILLDQVTDGRLRQLAALGVRVEIADVNSRRVQARVPVSRLQRVAALPFVSFIRRPTYAVHRIGSKTSEGDAILSADVGRAQFSVDGSSIRVGVVSDGLKGLIANKCTSCGSLSGGPATSNDLASTNGTRDKNGTLQTTTGGVAGVSFASDGDLEGVPFSIPPCGFAGAGAEGTALLEVVHDLAPGAALAFGNADTGLAFNTAVSTLATTQDVVVDDLGFYGEPADGTSSISTNTAAALNNNANRIRAYVTSVGNAAFDHYLATYADSGIDGRAIPGISSAGHLHLFRATADTTDVLGLGNQPYDLIAMPNGGEVIIVLNWNDPAGRSSNNYDLYLVNDATGSIAARSTDVQSGAQDPLEAIDFVNRGPDGRFRIVIQNVGNAAQARALNMFAFEPQCAYDGPRLLANGRHEKHNYNTVTRSLSAQSDAGGTPVSVISVGAICSASAAASGAFGSSESCNDRSHATIEFFSSRGPTLDGRLKPDISAIDGVSVTGTGKFPTPFFGTSAAAPHVAAIAALVLHAAPCLVAGGPGALDPVTARTTLRDLIVSSADPIGDPVPNNTFGSGIANAFRSIQRAKTICK